MKSSYQILDLLNTHFKIFVLIYLWFIILSTFRRVASHHPMYIIFTGSPSQSQGHLPGPLPKISPRPPPLSVRQLPSSGIYTVMFLWTNIISSILLG